MSLPRGLKSPIYGNYRMVAPSGDVLCFCDRKKADWYVSRGLAQIVCQDVLLSFTPRGKGHAGDKYYLSPKANACVICGKDTELTRHHIVPKCFRKHFPDELKSRSSHDVCPMCRECHTRYESHAKRRNLELFKTDKYAIMEIPANGQPGAKEAFAVLNHGQMMPVEKKAKLLSRIEAALGRPPTEEDLKVLAEKKDSLHARSRFRELASELIGGMTPEEIQEFVRGWRRHFVEVMKPRFMPEGWDANR